MKRRLCMPCEELTNANPCRKCGADTDKLARPVRDWADLTDPREKGDDDGREYADPRDRQ